MRMRSRLALPLIKISVSRLSEPLFAVEEQQTLRRPLCVRQHRSSPAVNGKNLRQAQGRGPGGQRYNRNGMRSGRTDRASPEEGGRSAKKKSGERLMS